MNGWLGVAVAVLAWVGLVVMAVLFLRWGGRKQRQGDADAARALERGLTVERLVETMRELRQLPFPAAIEVIESKAAPAGHAYYAADPVHPGRRVLIVGSDVARRMRANGTILYDRPL